MLKSNGFTTFGTSCTFCSHKHILFRKFCKFTAPLKQQALLVAVITNCCFYHYCISNPYRLSVKHTADLSNFCFSANQETPTTSVDNRRRRQNGQICHCIDLMSQKTADLGECNVHGRHFQYVCMRAVRIYTMTAVKMVQYSSQNLLIGTSRRVLQSASLRLCHR